MQFLPTVPEGLPLTKLNEALRQWIEVYHTTVHSSTRQTPLERYLASLHLVREAPKDMDDYFRMRTLRRVDKDRTISLCGRLYEAPVALMGKMVTLLYHEKDPARVEVVFLRDARSPRCHHQRPRPSKPLHDPRNGARKHPGERTRLRGRKALRQGGAR